MVENRPFANLIAYLILGLGVLVVAFPVYLAVVASTFDTATIVNGNMPLAPGSASGSVSSPSAAEPIAATRCRCCGASRSRSWAT